MAEKNDKSNKMSEHILFRIFGVCLLRLTKWEMIAFEFPKWNTFKIKNIYLTALHVCTIMIVEKLIYPR